MIVLLVNQANLQYLQNQNFLSTVKGSRMTVNETKQVAFVTPLELQVSYDSFMRSQRPGVIFYHW